MINKNYEDLMMIVDADGTPTFEEKVKKSNDKDESLKILKVEVKKCSATVKKHIIEALDSVKTMTDDEKTMSFGFALNFMSYLLQDQEFRGEDDKSPVIHADAVKPLCKMRTLNGNKVGSDLSFGEVYGIIKGK